MYFKYNASQIQVFKPLFFMWKFYLVGKKGFLNSLIDTQIRRTSRIPLETNSIIQPPSPLEFPGSLTPLPFGISNSLRGGGMDIFWNHTLSTFFLCCLRLNVLHLENEKTLAICYFRTVVTIFPNSDSSWFDWGDMTSLEGQIILRSGQR